MARVTALVPAGDGSQLTIHEEPVAGPIAIAGVHKVTEALLAVRNREMARRLHKLLRERQRGRARASAQNEPGLGASS
jgi:hypothetical protein